MFEKIFSNKAFDYERVRAYGFEVQGGNRVYSRAVCGGQMRLTVTIDERGEVSTEVTDLETQEPYTLYMVESAVGGFVGGVRSECERVLTDIADKCCFRRVFTSNGAIGLIEYAREKYGDELEFLWKKFDDNAVWRRKDNGKWYGLILKVSARKLGLDSDEVIEITDIRAKPETIESIIDGEKYFHAYHMNKVHWLTMRLDGSVSVEELCHRLDESYALAKKK